MKKAIIICFLFMLQSGAESQTSVIDSFKQVLSVAKEDTNKVKLINRLAELYQFTNADTAIVFAEHAYSLADSLHYRPGMAYANLFLSGAYTTMGNYRLALYYTFKCRDLAKELNMLHLYIRTLSHLHSCYSSLGEFDKALHYAREAIPLVQEYFPHRTSFPYVEVAKCFEDVHNYDSALYYAKKSLSDYSSATFQNTPGEYFVGLDPHAFILSTLASIYSDKGNYDSALFYFRNGVAIAVRVNIGIDLIDIYNGMSALFIKTNNLDSATWYCKKVLADKLVRSYPFGLLAATEMLSQIYQKESKADSTLKYLEAATTLKDSLFNSEKTIAAENMAFDDQEKEKELEATQLKYQNKLKIFILSGVLIAVIVFAFILYRHNRQRQRAYAQLMDLQAETTRQKAKTEEALSDLKSTQSQLIQSEKMASLGELTAGIAHEIQNPLNFVNNFSEVNKELLSEMNAEIDKENFVEVKAIAKDVIDNEEKINHHGKRADAIVKGMLQHSRSSTGVKELADINVLADEYLRLSYHGLKAKDKNFNATMKTDFDKTIGKINIIPQDVGRVLLNLYNNAFYAVAEKKKLQSENYEPTISISTGRIDNKIVLTVMDNGNGIPQKVIDKIFQPFFTTKPTGEGTGLGLSLSYDSIKAHGGEIKVETKEGEGTEFIIQLPIS
ncbi:MAG TPA: ATP-binding protein [Puia sp.]|jgi:two-component system NtrC family sensor kinase|nr:ATP-binding protein [Puia sp.]